MKDKKLWREELKQLHDKIKENPYWMSFDKVFLPELLNDLYRIGCLYYDYMDYTNPYYAMLRALTHDYNCLIDLIRYSIKKREDYKYMDKAIVVFQTYLTLIHGMIEGNRQEDVVGYLLKNGDLKKYLSLYDESKKQFYVVNVISSKGIPAVIEYCEKFVKHGSGSIKDWCEQCLEEIKNGEKIIGRHWLIKD